jgi:glutamate dehydrogenase
MMDSDLSLNVRSKDEEGIKYTYINSQAKSSGFLHSQIKNLVVPEGHQLSNVDVFSSMDGDVALNIFSFEPVKVVHSHPTRQVSQKVFELIDEIKAGKHNHESWFPKYSESFSESSINDYLNRVTPNYINQTSARRVLIQKEMFDQIRNSDGSVVKIEPYVGVGSGSMSWITIAASNVLPEVLLRLESAIISARGLDITRAHLHSVECPEISTADIPGQVTILRLLVSPLDESKNLNTNTGFADVLARDLRRAKWFDNTTTDLGLTKHPHLGLDKAEVITALCSMLHGPLFKLDSASFSSIKSVLQLVEGTQNIALAEKIAALFLDRFNPASPLPDAEFQRRSAEIRGKLSTLPNESSKILVGKMLDAVHATLRTNFFNADRYALSLRVDPMIMMPAGGPTPERPLPFGVFFCHGRHFNAFHNRFRDIARGGLRLVTPQNSDQYALESTRQYDEVYGLSYAQQLKNKDIPEGGSKGVILINTPVIPDQGNKFFAMRKAVKAFSDALLDLIVKNSVSNLVDFYGKDELIYLGPDEQIIPSDIEWIITRAAQRGYPLPAAFMSSKKDDGFNHKEFGVTSEGVKVYLDVALRTVLKKVPEKESFTVKITGGPDGDVAGNLIRILYRDYGSNCKVVGVADGFGVAEDPEGLDQEELLRLVHESKSIDNFNKAKLGPNGVVFAATPGNEEGINRRNSMHFRVKSDIFVPAGGRPNTINGENWRKFLDENGKPSSPLIVEGANIFNTPEARKNLFEKAGVIIVKDSSANKCGVVTSSCEVMSSMLLSKDEFMAIKPALVEDVLERLRLLARLEGELLFKEYRNYPGALPHFSERISMAIAKVTDAVTDALANVQPSDPLFEELRPLIRENLPKKLAEVAGDRIASRFPLQYQRNAIASALASQLVYQEGIHLVEAQPQEKTAERAFAYYHEHKKMQSIVSDLETLNLGAAEKHKGVIVDILKRGGARTSLDIF